MEKKAEFTSIDRHFGQFVSRLAKDNFTEILLLSELVSMVTRAGHGCLDLRDWAGSVVVGTTGVLSSLPALDELRDIIALSGVSGGGKDGMYPFVLESDRLYLRRYWEYEETVATFVLGAAFQENYGRDSRVVLESLQRLFPEKSEGFVWHRIAAFAALKRPFVVISGGPGTGKTTTVARIMALLTESSGVRGMRIALAAPTGKAVMRLQESIAGSLAYLDCSSKIIDNLPAQAKTLHRLLGVIKDSPNFRYNSANKLPYDLVVVDEASMIDLPLMAKLVSAISSQCKLIILGDRDQLSSVEPGSVLGDICRSKAGRYFSTSFVAETRDFADTADLEEAAEGAGLLADSLVELQTCFRFSEDSGIGKLALAIKEGRCDQALELAVSNEYSDLVWREFEPDEGIDAMVRDLLDREGLWSLKGSSPEEMLSAMEKIKILCVLRGGPFGAEDVNRKFSESVSGQRLNFGENLYFDGLPLMITRNDYQLGLFNGDTGVVTKKPGGNVNLGAFFPAADSSVRSFSLSALPSHEACYAMTVHKSQGSEFGEVILILPDKYSQVLTRELVYTAVTRARQKIEIWGSKEVFRKALDKETFRSSGLGEKLWGS